MSTTTTPRPRKSPKCGPAPSLEALAHPCADARSHGTQGAAVWIIVGEYGVIGEAVTLETILDNGPHGANVDRNSVTESGHVECRLCGSLALEGECLILMGRKLVHLRCANLHPEEYVLSANYSAASGANITTAGAPSDRVLRPSSKAGPKGGVLPLLDTPRGGVKLAIGQLAPTTADGPDLGRLKTLKRLGLPLSVIAERADDLFSADEKGLALELVGETLKVMAADLKREAGWVAAGRESKLTTTETNLYTFHLPTHSAAEAEAEAEAVADFEAETAEATEVDTLEAVAPELAETEAPEVIEVTEAPTALEVGAIIADGIAQAPPRLATATERREAMEMAGAARVAKLKAGWAEVGRSKVDA